jgi:hypothetical protein
LSLSDRSSHRQPLHRLDELRDADRIALPTTEVPHEPDINGSLGRVVDAGQGDFRKWDEASN